MTLLEWLFGTNNAPPDCLVKRAEELELRDKLSQFTWLGFEYKNEDWPLTLTYDRVLYDPLQFTIKPTPKTQNKMWSGRVSIPKNPGKFQKTIKNKNLESIFHFLGSTALLRSIGLPNAVVLMAGAESTKKDFGDYRLYMRHFQQSVTNKEVIQVPDVLAISTIKKVEPGTELYAISPCECDDGPGGIDLSKRDALLYTTNFNLVGVESYDRTVPKHVKTALSL